MHMYAQLNDCNSGSGSLKIYILKSDTIIVLFDMTNLESGIFYFLRLKGHVKISDSSMHLQFCFCCTKNVNIVNTNIK